MAVTLRYFTEFGKHTFQHITTESSCGGICEGVYCFLYHVYDVVVKKVHVRYLISWWVSCQILITADLSARTARYSLHHVISRYVSITQANEISQVREITPFLLLMVTDINILLKEMLLLGFNFNCAITWLLKCSEWLYNIYISEV